MCRCTPVGGGQHNKGPREPGFTDVSVIAIQADSAATKATAAAEAPAVRAIDLSKSIDDRPVLDRINLEVPRGSYLMLLGANGAGKSTMLNVMATLTPFTYGQLHLLGEPVGRGAVGLRARIGMIGHQPMLYRDLSARENLVFFGRLYGVQRPAERAEQMLAEVGLADRAADQVGTFSRGMVQRVAIARALMHDPELLLADEPFSGLDLPSIRKLEALLKVLHRGGKTVIQSNHDVDQSLRLAQRVLVLRRGRLVADHAARTADAETVAEEVTTS